MNQLNIKLAALFAASAVAGAAQATTVNLSYNDGSLFSTTGISSFDVTGKDMVGMSVTACFDVAGCQTLAWQNLGSGPTDEIGGVIGTGWSLGLNGDSFAQRFVMDVSSQTALVSLSINGRPGLTAFDVTPGVSGSPGSALGLPFTLQTGPGSSVVGSIDAVYSDKLAVGGVFYDDLYTVMTLNFNGGSGFKSGRMEFSADTDKTLSGAPITPATPVPTPGTLALVGLGLLAAAAKSRRNAQS